MRARTLWIGVMLAVGFASLLVVHSRHQAPGHIPHEVAADTAGVSLIACSSAGACSIAAASNRDETRALTVREAMEPLNSNAQSLHATADPVLSALLPQNENVTLQGRTVERWKARTYFCPGDFNRDDAIDQQDIEDFLEAFANRSGPLAEFLDINQDGAIDGDDLNALIQASFEDCDPEQAALNRNLICIRSRHELEAQRVSLV